MSNSMQNDLNNIFDIERYGNVGKLFRDTAYVKRYIELLKAKVDKSNYVSSLELQLDLEKAKLLWIQNEQKNVVNNNNKMNQLKCTFGLYFDNEGVLRLKGRLEHSDLCYESKHLIYLETGSYLTK